MGFTNDRLQRQQEADAALVWLSGRDPCEAQVSHLVGPQRPNGQTDTLAGVRSVPKWCWNILAQQHQERRVLTSILFLRRYSLF